MRNLSKILLALLCTALCLTACAEKEAATDATIPTVAAGATYTGTISALSLTSITVQTENGDVVIPLSDSTVFTRDLDAGELQPPQNGDNSIGGDMGTLPEGDMPEDPVGGELPPDGMGNMGGMEKPNGNGDMQMPGENGDIGGMGDMGNMGGMGQMGDPNDKLDSFLGEASIYSLTLGMHVSVTTDENALAATVTFTQNMLIP